MEIALYSAGNINIIAESHAVFNLFKKINDNLLIDRLYRRYVKRIDNIATVEILKEKVDLCPDPLLTCLINKLEKGIKGSELSLKTFDGDYVPVRLGIGDIFYSMVEEDIPLEDYDNLEGDPLWTRPEYMLEKYG